MYSLIITFYVSLAGIIGMILLKRREILTGRKSIVSRFGSETDHIFSAVFGTVKRTVSYFNKHTFIAFSQWIAFHVLLRIRKIYVEIKHRSLQNPHARKVIDAVRGRAEIRHEGASFYLRRIAGENPHVRTK